MPIDVFLDQFNECERIRSLDDIFNFRESEKSLTMDSLSFSKFSLLSPKKVKFTEENSLCETNLLRCTFSSLIYRLKKGVNSC